MSSARGGQSASADERTDPDDWVLGGSLCPSRPALGHDDGEDDFLHDEFWREQNDDFAEDGEERGKNWRTEKVMAKDVAVEVEGVDRQLLPEWLDEVSGITDNVRRMAKTKPRDEVTMSDVVRLPSAVLRLLLHLHHLLPLLDGFSLQQHSSCSLAHSLARSLARSLAVVFPGGGTDQALRPSHT